MEQPIAAGSTEDGQAVEPGLEHAGVRTVQGGDRAHRLANTFSVPKERTEEFLILFRRQAEFMTAQPGSVFLQTHKGTAGSRLLMNVAVREPIEALAATFGSPEFQRTAATFPDDVVSCPHIFERVDVWHRSCGSVTVLVSDPALHGTLATRSAGDTPDERSMPIPPQTTAKPSPARHFTPGATPGGQVFRMPTRPHRPQPTVRFPPRARRGGRAPRLWRRRARDGISRPARTGRRGSRGSGTAGTGPVGRRR